MFGSVMLDVAIGLVLIYLILSFVAAAIREGIEVHLKDRSRLLEQGIRELLCDPTPTQPAATSGVPPTGLTKDLYEHPLIGSLYQGATYEAAKRARNLPSYIPAKNFAVALMDMVVRGRDTNSAAGSGAGTAVISSATLRQNIQQLGSAKVQRVILSALDVAQGDVVATQKAIENWFNTGMDRVSGWYKRKSQIILIGIGFGVAWLANVDTLRIANALYTDPGQRQAMVAIASQISIPNKDTAKAALTEAQVDQVMTKLDSLELPIGWPDAVFQRPSSWATTRNMLMRILGWLITGFAISLGAPFWFDMLNKIMVIRSTVKPHEKSGEEGSADRQSDQPNSITINAAPPGTSPAAPPPPVALPPNVAGTGAPYRAHEWAAGHAQEGVI